MSEFKWKVLILDDSDPSVIKIVDTVKELSKCGLQAEVLGRPVNGIWENHEVLLGVDFAFCDMRWDIADYEEESFLPDSEFIQNHQAYVKQWLKALCYWIDQTDLPTKTDTWPRGKIEADHAGLWIAAMLKQSSRDAQIILYSRDPQIAALGPLAAIARFPDTSFQVMTKLPTEPLLVAPLERLLKQQQRERLRRPDLRRWFLADVLMRSLVGGQPKERDLQSLHGKDKLTFKAELFFPNFKAPGQFKAEDVQDLLEFFGSDLTPWQRSGLHGMEHRLKGLLKAAQAISDQEVRSLISECYACGEAGEPLGVVLQRASGSADRAQTLKEALILCRSALASRESDLITLCAEHNGSVSYDESAATYAPGVEGDNDRTNPELPFQYYYLRHSVDHLFFNASANKTTGRLTRQLSAHISGSTCRITWLDDSDGFDSWDGFREKLVESMDHGGEYRGLPIGILFGLRYNAQLIEVLIKGAGRWHTLWPIDSQQAEVSGMSMSFGLRWTFAYKVP